MGTGVWFARLNSVRLRHFALAYRLEDQVALLTCYVRLVEEGCKLRVEAKPDVEVAVGFLANLVYGAGDRKAGAQDLKPSRIVDVLPEVLITLRDGCLRGCEAAGGLRGVPQPVAQESARRSNKK
jgi:hypothetical protein